jgi:hypothetical protein
MGELANKWYSYRSGPDEKLRFIYKVKEGPNYILYADSMTFTKEQGRWFSEMEEVMIIEQERMGHYLGTEIKDFESTVNGYEVLLHICITTIFGDGWK